MTEIRRFRKKPVEIQAVLFDGSEESASNVAEWCGGLVGFRDVAHEDSEGFYTGSDRQWVVSIPTMEGRMTASPGDWVIRGVQGEHYPCKPDIFDATYEAAES